ncbi:MAG: RluA family pseudouridine synthase [Myxococcales bacterium]|nr:RluA family pseudouridine synthase [Polyangiaceae bacterium]MDW8248392.1 RluA family pseudouridine synthase [Myxococcales bacterium]
MTLQVEAGDGGLRLDRFLALRWPDAVTRGQIQRWIEGGHVRIGGQVSRSSLKVQPGMLVEVTPPPPLSSEAKPDPSITFPVLFEDDWLLVLNKPAGLVVHPARGHEEGTLVNGLLAHHGFEIEGEEGEAWARPGIVHRLDKGTSGVMVVARKDQAREGLKTLFECHNIERAYLAITVGTPRPGRIETLHGRHPTDRLRFTTRVRSGKRAVTDVEVLKELGACALVRCRLSTGRTHQIRVHLTEVAGTPLLGDPVYGKLPREPRLRALADDLGRQALHAAVLGFVHPITGERLRFETPLPDDMARVLAALGG